MMNTDGEFFGVKYATLLAGFAGGVVSLSYVKALRPWEMVAAVGVGTITAAFLTPGLIAYLRVPTGAESAAAFLVGLTAMNTVPGIIRLSSLFRDAPLQMLREAAGKHFLVMAALSAINAVRRLLRGRDAGQK
jgi:hypothetical protein